MKTLIVLLSALVFVLIAAAHVYRAYAGIEVVVAGHAVPMACSWTAAAVTGILALGLLFFARK